MGELRAYVEERCIPEPNTGCWLWLASTGSHGYGNARANGMNTTAHRVSFVAFKGEIPDGMLVQHSCDNKLCVNPDHLSLGTDKTNSDDKHRKGRANLASRKFGPHPTRKLSDREVIAIRLSGEKQHVLAERFGVTQKAISNILHRRHYREVPDSLELSSTLDTPAANDDQAMDAKQLKAG